MNEARLKASVMVVTLKKLNRLEKIRTKAGRDTLHKEKQKLDSMHLLLQNLLYEANHLDKEVTKCLQFKSKDEEIDLVSVENFYKCAPEDVSRPVSKPMIYAGVINCNIEFHKYKSHFRK